MNTQRRGAFTFVEVLAALAFLGALIPVVVAALTLSNRAGVVSERTLIATQLAENRLGELMIDNAWSSAESRGEFGDQWPGFRWELAHTAWEAGEMTEVTIDVFFAVQGREHDVRLSTLANEALTSSTTP
jgi:type II secretory pathway pseudopilin PulG